MIGDNAIGDREAQSGPAAISALREEWNEKAFEHFLAHAAAIVLDRYSDCARVRVQGDFDTPVPRFRVE